MRGGTDENVSGTKWRASMSKDKESIYIPLPDKDSPADFSFEAQETAFHLLKQSFSKITETITRQMPSAEAVTNILTSAVESLRENISIAINTDIVTQALVAGLQEFKNSIAKTVANFDLPDFTEEERQKILESHGKWGEYGWTWIPSAPSQFFYSPPVDIKDANTKAKNYYSDEEIDKVFQRLRTYKLRKDDLESAIYCFQNRQYKPCALVLFGLIESKLIRKQRKDWRAVGIGAVTEIRTQIESSDELKFYTMLWCANLFSYLSTVFANANNFKNEPIVINRNFIDHGMSNRRVRKRDCVQLFFALENLLHLMQYIK